MSQPCRRGKTSAEPVSEEDLELLLRSFGNFDYEYLTRHYRRYADTFRRFHIQRAVVDDPRLLDVGAHWLHQAAMWALAGYKVTALDMPVTLDSTQVRRLADQHGIALIREANLEESGSLEAVAADSFDVILFTEILEHITFNPVHFWCAVYRVLRPGGRIVITTPNYYALRGRVWSPRRFLMGSGGGLNVQDILSTPTYGPHWKEYSRREIVRYFSLLSPDFSIEEADYVPAFGSIPPRRRFVSAGLALEQALPWLRPNLYVEVVLTEKRHGITARAEW